MARRALACVGVLALAACTAQGPPRPALSEAELLSGEALAVSIAQPVPVSADAATALDAEMRAFVADTIGELRHPRAKLDRLLAGMQDRQLLELDYAGAVTRTARDTFHSREGNCLSFTMLFVALAREAGLDVRYQIVDVPPNWASETGVIVVRHHINAVVRGGVHDDYTVDFNLEDIGGDYRKRVVSDAYTLALFYNNLGAEALIRRDNDLAFRYLRESARAFPGISATWVNIGALYSKGGRAEHAEAAYLHALALNPGERSALNNLVHLYSITGNDELAAAYRERVRRYQLANPYYHYALAQRAYAEARFDDAVAALRSAVRLKRDEPLFYVLLGRAYLATGRAAPASSSFERGRSYAATGAALAEYEAQIEALTDAAAPR
jgi:Flp pilus assembly protein TadD